MSARLLSYPSIQHTSKSPGKSESMEQSRGKEKEASRFMALAMEVAREPKYSTVDKIVEEFRSVGFSVNLLGRGDSRKDTGEAWKGITAKITQNNFLSYAYYEVVSDSNIIGIIGIGYTDEEISDHLTPRRKPLPSWKRRD